MKSYANAHFFRHFQDYNKMLGIGTGFWVNKPQISLRRLFNQ